MRYRPVRLSGVDLGDVVEETRRKLGRPEGVELCLERGDLTCVDLGPHDFAYCIGVIHHLQRPLQGFEAVLRHVKPGGRFHCSIYSREGNSLVIHGVDPVRRLSARLPWWMVQWGPGLAIAAGLLAYVRVIAALDGIGGARLADALPWAGYCRSFAGRDFAFFHFLATDFLVARHTVYLDRACIESWLRRPEVESGTGYLIHRNGNSWTFGGRRSGAA